VVQSLLLQAVSKSSMLKKDSKMSQQDAKLAEIQEKTMQDQAVKEEKDNCLTQYVQTVEWTLRFHSNQQTKDQFTAEIALHQ
jgi:hypothetical protein